MRSTVASCTSGPKSKAAAEPNPCTNCWRYMLLQLTVRNDIPADYPTIDPGISIHFHGFNMKNYPW